MATEQQRQKIIAILNNYRKKIIDITTERIKFEDKYEDISSLSVKEQINYRLRGKSLVGTLENSVLKEIEAILKE